MNEIILLLQAILLIAGWLLFLRAQQELRAQAAKQSLTGEADSLRRSVEALIHRLVNEAERVDRQLKETMRQANTVAEKPSAAVTETPPCEPQGGRYAEVYTLADEGRPISHIARDMGMLPGEVELILNLRPADRAYAHRTEGD